MAPVARIADTEQAGQQHVRLVTMSRRRAARTDGPAAELGLLLDASTDSEGGRVLPLTSLPGLTDDPKRGRALDDGDMAALLAADPGLEATRGALGQLGAEAARSLALGREIVRLLAPVARPGKVVCVGNNYLDHIREQGIEPPEHPLIFAKFANAVVGDRAPVIRPAATQALDLEAELAAVIGRPASRVSAADAMGFVLGYTVVDDVSARDLQGSKPALRPGQRGDGQWLRAKGSDTFLPMGPALVTRDEVPDPYGLAIRSWRTAGSVGAGGMVDAMEVSRAGAPDGAAPMQDGTTAELLFRLPELIEFITAAITLEPGDIIATGTPPGVGIFRHPPVLLEPGDVASCSVEGIGRIDNPIVAFDGSAPPGSPADAILNERA